MEQVLLQPRQLYSYPSYPQEEQDLYREKVSSPKVQEQVKKIVSRYPSLSPEVKKGIDEQKGLSPEVQKQVGRCVSRYTSPKTFCERLSYIVFRVWNAVKAIFGKSDWQLARRSIKTSNFSKDRIANSKKKISSEISNKAAAAKIIKLSIPTLNKLFNSGADLNLKVLVEMNGTHDQAKIKKLDEKLNIKMKEKSETSELKHEKEMQKIAKKYEINLKDLDLEKIYRG